MRAFNKKRKLKHTTKPKLRYWEPYQYYFLEATSTKKKSWKFEKASEDGFYKVYPSGYNYEKYLKDYNNYAPIIVKKFESRYTFFWSLNAINRRNHKYKLKMGLL